MLSYYLHIILMQNGTESKIVIASMQKEYSALVHTFSKCFLEQKKDKTDIAIDAASQKSLVKSFALKPGLHPQPSQSTIKYELTKL